MSQPTPTEIAEAKDDTCPYCGASEKAFTLALSRAERAEARCRELETAGNALRELVPRITAKYDHVQCSIWDALIDKHFIS